MILALLATGLVTASAWGANTASLVAVSKEAHRAADLSALAGAANVPLVGALSAGEPETTACRVASTLLARPAAVLTNALSATGTPPACGAGVSVTSEADWDTVATVQSALTRVVHAAGLDVPNLCAPLVRTLIDPLLAALTSAECATLSAALGSLPADVAPAVVSPRVAVAVTASAHAPVPLPAFAGAHPISATATARRRFKALIVLPQNVHAGPVDLSAINPSQTATEVRDVLLPQLESANGALGVAVNPHLPPGVSFDLSSLLLDVRDLYDPAAGTPPSPVAVAREAARTGDPVVILRLFRMPVLGVPALDFTAAYVSPLATDPPSFRATPIPASDLTAARGLFVASLVK